MSPSPRGPRACLLLFGLALGAAVALETMPGEGPVAVSVAVGSVDPGSVDPAPGIDEPAPGTTMPSRRAPGGMLTAGALGGQGAPGSARAERGGPQATDDPGARRAGDVRPPVRDGWTATAVDQWARRTAPALLAGVGALELLAPVVDPVVIGFHEASTSAGLELHPLGRLLANDTRTRFTPPPEVRDGAQPYVILASRGRAAGPT
ncbi:MAG TPA: hypothetical protein VK935_21700, partial [Actinomycetospora sp.]|nr:hypothetical protein [Actinomycetospora sp.]